MVPAKRSGFPVIKKSGNLSFFCNISSLSGVKYADSPQGSVHGGAGCRGERGKDMNLLIIDCYDRLDCGTYCHRRVRGDAGSDCGCDFQAEMDVLSKAVENGQEIDPALFADEKSSKSLKLRLINRATWGVVLSVVAIVMLACALFVNDDPEGLVISGGIILAVGIGMLFSFFAGKRWLTPEIEADEMRLRAEAEKARRILSGTDTDSRA